MPKWGERIFQTEKRECELHEDSNGNCVRIVNFIRSKKLLLREQYSHNEIFIIAPGTLPMGRVTTRLIRC
jgi:hypothetical protein